jgi:hypothetical protein
MRLNMDAMAVPLSTGLLNALTTLLSREDGPDICIETGTYLGNGSTALLARAWDLARPLKPREFKILTMEANPANFVQAQRNLAVWPFVQPLMMLSLDRNRAIEWMRQDPLLTGETDYPDIYCDVLGDLLGFYVQEMSPPAVPITIQDRGLTHLVNMVRHDSKLMFSLDSAGGVGLLEFHTVLGLMGDESFFLWLDDRNHLKHYRSWLEIEANKDGRWKVLFTDPRTVIAERLGAK